MRKLIFTLICLAITLQISFAQRNTTAMQAVTSLSLKFPSNKPTTRGLNGDSIVFPTSILVEHVDSSKAIFGSRGGVCGDSITNYKVTTGSGYANGNNSFGDKEKLEKFNLTGRGSLDGIYVFFYYANPKHGTEQISGVLHDFFGVVNDTSLPISLDTLAQNALFDTTNNNSNNSTMFGYSNFIDFNGTGAPPLDDSFIVGVILPSIAGDTLAIASTFDGCTSTNASAWEKRSDGKIYPMNASKASGGWGLNIDFCIFPIVDFNSNLLSAGLISKGLTLHNAYPNPASNMVNVNYSIDDATSVTIEFYDALGRQVISNNLGNESPGRYSQDVDVSKLAKGTYFYSVVTESSRLFGKIAVQ